MVDGPNLFPGWFCSEARSSPAGKPLRAAYSATGLSSSQWSKPEFISAASSAPMNALEPLRSSVGISAA